MAKRKASRAARSARPAKKKAAAKGRPAKRPSARKAARTAAPTRKAAKPTPKKRPAARKAAATAGPTKVPRLNRARRVLDEDTVLSTPPSSLNMDRKGSSARTGRAELDQSRRDHRTMTPEIAGGDVDVDVEDAYFTGEEAPGGDNPTPDQDVVDDIGKALGVEYADNEELKASDKVSQRDKHRWELDPASSEDFNDR
jgi:uncharacterized protein DUF6335